MTATPLSRTAASTSSSSSSAVAAAAVVVVEARDTRAPVRGEGVAALNDDEYDEEGAGDTSSLYELSSDSGDEGAGQSLRVWSAAGAGRAYCDLSLPAATVHKLCSLVHMRTGACTCARVRECRSSFNHT